MSMDRARTPDISPVQGFAVEDMPSIDAVTGRANQAPDLTGDQFERSLAQGLGEDPIPTVVHSPALAMDDENETPERNVRPRSMATPLPRSNGLARTAATSNTRVEPPTVDDATRALGIGWTKIEGTPDELGSARGAARFINNHFPMTNPQIVAENNNRELQLVNADGGFYLFDDTATQGQLVSTDPQDAITRLQKTPIDFMGPQPMLRAESSSANQPRSNGVSNVTPARETSDSSHINWSEAADVHPVLETEPGDLVAEADEEASEEATGEMEMDE